MSHSHQVSNQHGTNVELIVRGMTCAHCAMGVTKHLESRGLANVFVNLATGVVRYRNAGSLSPREVIKGINALGYEAQEYDADASENLASRPGVLSSIELRFLLSLPFTITLVLHMLLSYPLLHDGKFQLLLAFPVFILGLVHFGKSAFGSLRSRSPNMDVLIVLGFSAAFVYSLIGVLQGLGDNFLFFETAASIISFAMLGNVLEHRSINKTTSAIEDLHKLKETKAKLVTESGAGVSISEVEISSITQDQILQVNSGDKIPLDGVVIWGSASIDQSLLSGESAPIDVDVGSKVIGGTLLLKGNIRVRVEAIGKDTVLSRIIDLVEGAENRKPSIQKLGDRISAIFVPAVLLIAIATFSIWFWAIAVPFQVAMLNSIAVLVIACPCAMGLATPTAVMVAIGRAAKMGILFRGGRTFEELAQVKVIVFDKTGTITSGALKLADLKLDGIDEKSARAVISGLESHSSHPIAKSLIKELACENPKEFAAVREHKGLGIEGKDPSGIVYKIGSANMSAAPLAPGTYDLFLFKNETLVARLSLSDELRAGAEELFKFLETQKISTALLSGDRREKCEAIARKLGVTNVHSEKLPHEKLQIIEELQRIHPVAYVGDGVNDAPALALAQIGISLSSGSDIAMQSAQLVLLGNSLTQLKDALLISRLAYKTIKENLFWAFLYNILAIPVAALGFLSPMIGALAMAFSDVIVVGNSLRLRKRRLT